MFAKFKSFLKKVLPTPLYIFLLALRNWKDLFPVISFLSDNIPNVSLRQKLRIVKQLYIINFNVESPHTQAEILNFIRTILTFSPEKKGVIVEAGCFKGSSTAKFSLAADIAGRTLVVFDSFEGIPENDEPHDKNIFGGDASFKKGDYCGALEEVKSNVARFGNIGCCRFIKGWFDDTMPDFKEPVIAVYLDVDLASSTRTCLKYLYPLLEKGGVIYSQDGHLPLVLDVFNDDKFWLNEVGFEKPLIHGIGKVKLISATKEV
ncbi:MAG: class I SAM-dependent methyltransferase [Nitrosomonas sp.]|nr:class I SAM-dependent methyltransferase [Nitrosomonas sp.]